ncbi:MAG TPA: FAD binding domain-containing protein [Actinomycetota bacterium]|nr:FAD binding domain-containing protein [Actinomycetota bacterium]
MDVFLPTSLEEALEILADRPEAMPIAGGTDLMVALNFRRVRPAAAIDLTRVPELQELHRDDDEVFLGAGVTYSRIVRELRAVPTLVQASRTVGSPQIRARGTVGGNLGTGSPAGDALPVLAAHDADIELVAAGGRRRSLSWGEFLVGPKRTARAPDELILGARWRPIEGPGSFSKVGTRNAMVIAVASLCLQVDPDTRSVRVALGSVAPTVVRAPEAEASAAQILADAGSWDDPTAEIGDDAARGFADLVARAATPIDDVRGSAAYRRHAVSVMARRAFTWATNGQAAA